jgi:hypothetical protein
MKRLFFICLLLPLIVSNAQKIGELAPEKSPEKFPDNAWGLDILIGEGGFGLGTFYRFALANNFTGFVDFSISESKDDREFEYYDIFGRPIVIGKKNRVLYLPVNFGIQYRLFDEILTSNLRPYISAGVGPNIFVTTPYSKEFFNSFSYAQARYAIGGYVGFGANFGISKSNLVGLNVRYYTAHLFGEGIENIVNKRRTNISSFYLTLTIGTMY